MSTTIPESTAERIKDLVSRGQKIEAIKLCRESSAMGLAEAKSAVEKLENELRGGSPETFRELNGGTSPSQKYRFLDPDARSFRPSDFRLQQVPAFLVGFLVISAVAAGVGFLIDLFSSSVRFAILAFVVGCYIGIAIGKWSARRAQNPV